MQKNLLASAGQHGSDIRSDCWVQVATTPPDQPPTLQLTSKVAALYGESLRSEVASCLAALAANDLTITIDDSGALPFTLLARIEAAVRRLRPTQAISVLPPRNTAAQYPIQANRVRRSRLYLPGNTPKFFINAGLYGADAVILDLEDSVAPTEKDAALLLVRNALRVVNFYGAEKMVRLNRGTLGLSEVRTLAPHGVHTFVLPKVERVEEIQAVAQVLDEVQSSANLLPIIESAAGALQAALIATASPRIVALALGIEDYLTDIGAQRTAAGRESLWARSQVLNAARAAGIQPLASVFADVADVAGLRAWLQNERAFGFEGVGCLHPQQVAVVHEAFAPTASEIDEAKQVVAAYQAAEAQGSGVVALGNKMIDAPIVRRAERLLRLQGAG